MASEINEVLQKVGDKFEQLVSLYEKTRVEYDTLQMDKDKIEKEEQENRLKLVELEEKNKSLLISQAFASTSGSTEEAKEKISKIVREIDKCITLLSNK